MICRLQACKKDSKQRISRKFHAVRIEKVLKGISRFGIDSALTFSYARLWSLTVKRTNCFLRFAVFQFCVLLLRKPNPRECQKCKFLRLAGAIARRLFLDWTSRVYWLMLSTNRENNSPCHHNRFFLINDTHNVIACVKTFCGSP